MRPLTLFLSAAVLGLMATPRITTAQMWRTALTAAADAAIYVDWCQTVHGLHYGVPSERSGLFGTYRVTESWTESNPLLGSRPSVRAVTVYMVAWVAVNSFAPRTVRPFVNAATLLLEILTVSQNTAFIGLRLTP